MLATLVAMRRRLPGLAARALPELKVEAMWVYHQLASPRLGGVAEAAGIELIAWTVDDAERMRELLAMGVGGICTNDPRLFEVAERRPLSAPEPAQPEETGRRRRFGLGRRKQESAEETG